VAIRRGTIGGATTAAAVMFAVALFSGIGQAHAASGDGDPFNTRPWAASGTVSAPAPDLTTGADPFNTQPWSSSGPSISVANSDPGSDPFNDPQLSPPVDTTTPEAGTGTTPGTESSDTDTPADSGTGAADSSGSGFAPPDGATGGKGEEIPGPALSSSQNDPAVGATGSATDPAPTTPETGSPFADGAPGVPEEGTTAEGTTPSSPSDSSPEAGSAGTSDDSGVVEPDDPNEPEGVNADVMEAAGYVVEDIREIDVRVAANAPAERIANRFWMLAENYARLAQAAAPPDVSESAYRKQLAALESQANELGDQAQAGSPFASGFAELKNTTAADILSPINTWLGTSYQFT
jgi:hypothetical protein